MRRLNLKFLVVMLAVSGIVAAGAVSLWAYNVSNSVKVVLSKAEDAYKKGDLRGAVLYYTEYLRHLPRDREKQTKRAMIAGELAKKEDAPRTDVDLAYKLLEQALREEGSQDNYDLRRKLIDVQRKLIDTQMVRSGLRNEVLINIDKLSEAGKSDPELDFLYAQYAFDLKSFDRATPRLERLLGYDAKKKRFDSKLATGRTNVEAYMLLALILREQRKQHEDAEAVINEMVSANPKSAKALINRSQFKIFYGVDNNPKQNQQRLESAKNDLREALKLDPNNVQALSQNAVLAAMDKNYADAVKHLEHALKLTPKNEELYRQMAGMLYQQQKPKEAIAQLEAGLKEVPKSQKLVWTLYQFHFELQDAAAAQKAIDQMEKLKMAPERIALAKGRLPMLQQKWAEAARLLEDASKQLGLYPDLALAADLALGDCYFRLRQPDLQLKAYTRILQTDPNNEQALRGKAVALTTLGRFQEAYEVYQKDLVRIKGPEAFRADRGLLTGYLTVLTELAKRDEERRAFFEGKIIQIRKLLPEAVVSPVEKSILQAGELLAAKKVDEAVALLTEAIKEFPKEVRLQSTLVLTVAARDGVDAGLKRLADVERELGTTPDTSMLRAELLARKGGTDARQRLVEMEAAIGKMPAQQQPELWARMGRHYYRLGPAQRVDVLRCWRKALELRPNDGALLEGVFELARESGDPQAMITARDEIEQRLGRDSSLWQYAEASRLVSLVRRPGPQSNLATLDQASKLVEQAVSQRSDWYMILRLQGEIADLKQDYDAAIANYTRALDNGPANPAVVQRVVELHLARQEFAKARACLERLGDASPMLGRLYILAKVLARGDKDASSDPEEVAKILKTLEREVPESSKNPSDLLWKGQLLLRLNQLDKAEAALRSAVQYGPNLAQTWLALVEFLAKFRTTQQAEQVIREAENQLPDDTGMLVLAQSYTLIKAYDRAEHYYLAAQRSAPMSPALARTIANFYLTAKAPGKAVNYLQSLIAAAGKLRPEDQQHVVWARRELALVLSQSPSYPEFQAAIRLIEENANSNAATASDAMLIGRFHSQRRNPRSLRQAEQILEKFRSTPGFGFDEKLALANVYIATNQGEKAKRTLEDLYAERPTDAQVIVLAAETLIKMGQTESAQDWVRRLEALVPDSPQVTRLGALVEMRRQRPKDAEQLVTARLPKEVTADNVKTVLQAAEILEAVKHFEAAEKLYRATLAAVPAAKLAVAKYFARRGNTLEALPILKSELSDKTLAEISLVGAQAVRDRKLTTGIVDPAECKLVLSWFDQARTRGNVPLSLASAEATLLDAVGQTADAERIYRGVLAQPNLPPLLRAESANNLAYLLAISGRDLREAQEHIDFALTQFGPDPKLLDTQAMVALGKDNAAEAIKLLTEATNVDATPDLFFHLALAYQKADDRGAAIRSLVRARQEGLREQALSAPEQKRLGQLDVWLKVPVVGNK